MANEPSYTAGSTLTFNCNSGYRIDGQAELTCRNDGSWNMPAPTCKIENCGTFGTIPNGQTFQETSDGVENNYGSRVRVDCNYGYVLDGLKYVMCQEDGTWEPKPVCRETTCPPYPGINSSCVKDTLVVRKTFYLSCKSDVSVTKTGGDSADCLDSGQWSDPDLGCYCDCFLDDLESNVVISNVNEKGYILHKTYLHWDCRFLNDKETDSDIICVDGKLTGIPTCKISVTNIFIYLVLPVVIGIVAVGVIGFVFKKIGFDRLKSCGNKDTIDDDKIKTNSENAPLQDMSTPEKLD